MKARTEGNTGDVLKVVGFCGSSFPVLLGGGREIGHAKSPKIQNLIRNIGPPELSPFCPFKGNQSSFRLSPNRPLSEKSRSNLKHGDVGLLFQFWV